MIEVSFFISETMASEYMPVTMLYWSLFNIYSIQYKKTFNYIVILFLNPLTLLNLFTLLLVETFVSLYE